MRWSKAGVSAPDPTSHIVDDVVPFALQTTLPSG